ncbi:MAG: GNAT family N-acetyltransferase [Rhizobiales bacterium]|nr:GNAT family N-acetyltransferase [Hyphomicrobiales bacterium]
MARRPDTVNPAPTYARLREKTLALHRLRGMPGLTRAAARLVEPVQEHLILALHTELAPVEGLWTAFQHRAHSTFYQTFLWCRAWCETVGKARNVEIRIVTARNQNGETAFILPLQIRRRSGIRVLEWLGTPHTTYGHGLFAPAFLPQSRDWFSRHWTEVVSLAGPDAVHLVNMPAALGSTPHPLQKLFNMRGPNRCYRMALSPDYDTLLAEKRSKETRRYYRKKERAFAARGDLSFVLPATLEEAHATLRTMFEQQEKRLGERGVHGVFGSVEREFIYRLASLQDETDPVLLPYTLKFQGQPQAVLLGGVHDNSFWAMISSLAETDLRKYSPGDLALRRTIEASCKRGLGCFDFAAGDSDYKRHWADEVTPLHLLLAATNLRGLIWVGLMGAATLAKRLVKQSPALRNAAMSLRKGLLGKPLRREPAQD